MSINKKSLEEVKRMNVALRHCAQLKTQLNDALAHVQQLDAKYNQTDYSAILRQIENNVRSVKTPALVTSVRSKSRNRIASPYQTQRSLRQDKPKSKSNESLIMAAAAVVTPIKSTNPTPSDDDTPKMRPSGLYRPHPLVITRSNASSNQSLPDMEMFDTPPRSLRVLRAESNRVKVDAIKVQRDLESMIMKLQHVQREQLRVHRLMSEQSIYLSSSNSLLNKVASSYLSSPAYDRSKPSTPTSAKRSRFDDSEHVLRKVQVMYGTPLQKMHKRLKNLNAALVKSC